jgi:hypothetical protein
LILVNLAGPASAQAIDNLDGGHLAAEEGTGVVGFERLESTVG